MSTLVVGTGMQLDEVQRRSTLRLDLQGLRDDSPVVIEEPVELQYATPQDTLLLGSTRTVWVNQLCGVVVDVAAAPQLQALPLNLALQLATELRERLARGGFRASAESGLAWPDLGGLQEQIAAVRAGGSFSRKLGQWVLNGQRATLTLKRLADPPAGLQLPAGDALFLVDLYVSDDALDAAQRKLLLQSRKEAGLPPGDKLPLSRWVHPPSR